MSQSLREISSSIVDQRAERILWYCSPATADRLPSIELRTHWSEGSLLNSWLCNKAKQITESTALAYNCQRAGGSTIDEFFIQIDRTGRLEKTRTAWVSHISVRDHQLISVNRANWFRDLRRRFHTIYTFVHRNRTNTCIKIDEIYHKRPHEREQRNRKIKLFIYLLKVYFCCCIRIGIQNQNHEPTPNCGGCSLIYGRVQGLVRIQLATVKTGRKWSSSTKLPVIA